MKKWNKEYITEIVRVSRSIADVLRSIGLPTNSGNYKTFHRYCRKWNLDISHFQPYKNNSHVLTIPLDHIIIKDCGHSQNALRNAIIRNKLIEYKCERCGNSGSWMSQDLSLHLDHINGVNNDNRIENLRFLCPNCHQQTSTFGSKNIGETPRCVQCGIRISKGSIRCIKCSNKSVKRCHRTKIVWPSVEDLKKMLKESSFCEVATALGVSDNAVRKHIKNHKKIVGSVVKCKTLGCNPRIPSSNLGGASLV